MPQPLSVTSAGVPEDVLDKERMVLTEQILNEKGEMAPDQLDKIVQGKLKKFFKENVLNEQEYVMGDIGDEEVDSKVIVGKFLKQLGRTYGDGVELSVTNFKVFNIGQ